MADILVGGCRRLLPWCKLGVVFPLGSTKMFSTATVETYFSCHKAIWISATEFICNLT